MGIYLNQVGYITKTKKVATATEKAGFKVVNAQTKEEVFCGEAIAAGYDEAAGEDAYLLDFSALTIPGNYYIENENGERSHVFVVSDSPYSKLHKDMLKCFYYQRCGCELKEEHAGVYTHKACHTAPSILLSDYMEGAENPKTYPMTGGWHDAGDFGRYTTAAATALGDLLYAYELFPDSFKDNLNIPESGNDMPDVLNECMYELEWMIKMQAEDGGVYHKLTAWRHAPFVMPEEDQDPFLIYPVSSMATADYAAVMALAYRIYKEFRPEFAKEALERAKKSWKWLTKHPYVGFKNPEGSNTGEYGDGRDEDERFWAAVELAKADAGNVEEYLAVAEAYAGKVSKTDFGWIDMSGFGSIAVLTDKEGVFPESLVNYISEAVFAEGEKLLEVQNKSGYGIALRPGEFNWGSNMGVCNKGMLLVLCALMCTEDKTEIYREGALSQLHYLLGRNALDISYVTGHGGNAFKNPHNRPTACDGIDDPMPGWVSGGPNGRPCDEAAMERIPAGTAPMKCYIDHVDSYSTNEITIYWNSPAVFMTAYFIGR